MPKVKTVWIFIQIVALVVTSPWSLPSPRRHTKQSRSVQDTTNIYVSIASHGFPIGSPWLPLCGSQKLSQARVAGQKQGSPGDGFKEMGTPAWQKLKKEQSKIASWDAFCLFHCNISNDDTLARVNAKRETVCMTSQDTYSCSQCSLHLNESSFKNMPNKKIREGTIAHPLHSSL